MRETPRNFVDYFYTKSGILKFILPNPYRHNMIFPIFISDRQIVITIAPQTDYRNLYIIPPTRRFQGIQRLANQNRSGTLNPEIRMIVIFLIHIRNRFQTQPRTISHQTAPDSMLKNHSYMRFAIYAFLYEKKQFLQRNFLKIFCFLPMPIKYWDSQGIVKWRQLCEYIGYHKFLSIYHVEILEWTYT